MRPFVVLWRYAFGKPDGWWPTLVCGLRGHAWFPCDDGCCGGRQHWCARCRSPRYMEPFA